METAISVNKESYFPDSASKDGDNGLPSAEAKVGDGAVETAHVVDSAAERSLCFKFDIRILPVLAVMCRSMDTTAALAASLINRLP